MKVCLRLWGGTFVLAVVAEFNTFVNCGLYLWDSCSGEFPGVQWVQWLRIRASAAGGMGSIPGRGTKIPHAAWCARKPKTKPQLKPGQLFLVHYHGTRWTLWKGFGFCWLQSQKTGQAGSNDLVTVTDTKEARGPPGRERCLRRRGRWSVGGWSADQGKSLGHHTCRRS